MLSLSSRAHACSCPATTLITFTPPSTAVWLLRNTLVELPALLMPSWPAHPLPRQLLLAPVPASLTLRVAPDALHRHVDQLEAREAASSDRDVPDPLHVLRSWRRCQPAVRPVVVAQEPVPVQPETKHLRRVQLYARREAACPDPARKLPSLPPSSPRPDSTSLRTDPPASPRTTPPHRTPSASGCCFPALPPSCLPSTARPRTPAARTCAGLPRLSTSPRLPAARREVCPPSTSSPPSSCSEGTVLPHSTDTPACAAPSTSPARCLSPRMRAMLLPLRLSPSSRCPGPPSSCSSSS
eukprot:766809-Hanusia_phi.AAC.2